MGQTLFTVEIPVEVEVIVPVEKVRYVERFQTVEREVCFSNFVMSEFAYQSDRFYHIGTNMKRHRLNVEAPVNTTIGLRPR